MIPASHAAVLDALTKLSQEDFAELRQVIEKRGEVALRGEMVDKLEGVLPASTSSLAPDLFAACFAAIGTHGIRGWSLQEVTEMVASELEFDSDAEKNTFRARFQSLLEVPTLYKAAKAADLLSDQQHGFHGARVLSDIRPVFLEKPGEPTGAVVVHTLKIEYHRSGRQIESIYVGMDSGDLRHLKVVIDRALEKAQSFESLAARADLELFQLGKEVD